jgi:REP element-mobilizing transposase RayT
VHLLISPPPALSPAGIVRYLKRRSSQLQQEFPHLSKRFSARSLWAPGYLCRTTGDTKADEIEKYVEGHSFAEDHEQFTIDGSMSP